MVKKRRFVRIEWKPQDCWVGVYWHNQYPWSFDVWVCLVPMVPIHFGWHWVSRHPGLHEWYQNASKEG